MISNNRSILRQINMTLPTFTVAGSCLLVGIAAGLALAGLSKNDVEPIPIVPTVASQSHNIGPDTNTADNSPFAVATKPDKRHETQINTDQPIEEKLNLSPSRFTVKDIHYASLNDYHQLMATLNRIDTADENQLLRWIEKAPLRAERSTVSRSINRALFQRLADLNPSVVVDWIKLRSEKLEQFHQDSLFSDATAGYALARTEDAENWLASLDKYDDSQLLVYDLTMALGNVNPENMLDQFSVLDGEEHGYAYEIASTWAATDPLAAMDWLEHRASGLEKDMLEASILENLMLQNPDAALAYIKNAPLSENNAWLLSRYGAALGQKDPQRALDWAFEQGDPSVLEETIRELSWVWPEHDLESLKARIEQIENPALRDRILVDTTSRLLGQIAENDPAAGMAWLDNQSESVQTQLRPQAVAMWLQSDPTSAAGWLRQQPDSDEYRMLLETVMWELPAIDLDLALDAYTRMEGGAILNFVGPLMHAIEQQRPSLLPSWVAQLTDPNARKLASTILDDQVQLRNPEQFIAELDQATGEERIEKLAILYRSWGSVASEKFEQWLNNNPLTPEDESALQRKNEELYPGSGGHC